MKNMMKKAKRMLVYLIVLVMYVDMLGQSAFISRAQGAEPSEASAPAEQQSNAGEQTADQQTAPSTESAASEQKTEGETQETGQSDTSSTETGTSGQEEAETTDSSKQQTVGQITGEATGDKKADAEKAAAVADLLSRIETALAVVIPDQESLKGTKEEMKALNTQGENLMNLLEECNNYKDVEEVMAAKAELEEATKGLQELLGLSAQLLDETPDGSAGKPWLVETAGELEAKVAAGGHIKLTKSFSLSNALIVRTAVSLDLSGNTLTTCAGTFGIGCISTLEISDSGLDSGTSGTIDASSGTSYGVLLQGTNAKVTLNGGTISSPSCTAVAVQRGANFVMNGGEIQTEYDSAVDVGGSEQGNTGGFTMNGGKISSKYTIAVKANRSGSTVVLNKGEITNEGIAVYIIYGAKAEIGGTAQITHTNSAEKAIYVYSGGLDVSGGNIETNGRAIYLGGSSTAHMSDKAMITSTNEGRPAVDVYGGEFTVSGGTISGNLVGVGFEGGTTFAMSGGTIKASTGVAAGVKGNFTMNGGTIEARRFGMYSYGAGFRMTGGTVSAGEIAVKGDGAKQMSLTGGSVSTSSTEDPMDSAVYLYKSTLEISENAEIQGKYAINLINGSSLTVSGGNVTAGTRGIFASDKESESEEGAECTATINGGVVNVVDNTGNIFDGSGKFRVTGGTFSNAFSTDYCVKNHYLKLSNGKYIVEKAKDDEKPQRVMGIDVAPSGSDADSEKEYSLPNVIVKKLKDNVQNITLKTKTISKTAVGNASEEVKKSVEKIGQTINQPSIKDEIIKEMKLDTKAQISKVNVQNYLDINLYNPDANDTISKTNKALSFTVAIPAGVDKAANFVIIRHHKNENGDEKVTPLPCSKDVKAGTLTFETDQFSVYAIATYEVAAASSDTNNGGGNSGSGNGGNNNNNSSQPASTASAASTAPAAPAAAPAIVAADPAAAPVAAVPPQPAEEEEKTQVPALKENKAPKKKEITYGDGATGDVVTVGSDETPLAIGKTESSWLIWLLSGMSAVFATAFIGFQLLTKRRRDEED